MFSQLPASIIGQLIAGDTASASVVYQDTNTWPVGKVVINEIMYAPLVPSAECVELCNNSPNTTFDLSGWQLGGLDYTFPAGSTLFPTNYLVQAPIARPSPPSSAPQTPSLTPLAERSRPAVRL